MFESLNFIFGYYRNIMSNYNQLLQEIIAFKSISTDKQYQDEITKLVAYLEQMFINKDFKVEVITGYGNPIVLAKYHVNDDAETCLIYGHYDVQPAEMNDGWKSNPFEVNERDGRLYARGVVDNKGQTLIHIASIFDLIEAGNLKYNITFMLEGDEETGSPFLENFVKENLDKLSCNFYMISDGTVLGRNPVIESGFRGGLNTTLTIKTAASDMHSGMYGGAVPNSAHVLGQFLSKLIAEDGTVNIPEFYFGVDEVPAEIIENNTSVPFSMEELERITGVTELVKDDQFDYYTQVALRPTIQVTGIKSGYTGEGYRNSIAAESTVKINFRLVQSQKPEDIAQKYEQFIKETLPSYATYELEMVDLYEGVKLDVSDVHIQESKKLLEETFGEKCYYLFSGGGLPIVTYFDAQLKVPGLLLPLGNEDCNMHALDENFDKDILEKGLKFSKAFFTK